MLGFDPSAKSVSFRNGGKGQLVEIPFSRFRRLTLTMPLQQAPQRPGAPVECVPAAAQEREYTLHLDDGAVAVDNNLIERQIKPWKIGAKNWLFAGSALAGQRAAVVMSLVQSAKLNGLDPWAYLRDVLACIHSHPSHRLDELLPHRWQPS